jgi:hypothetical protein
MIKLYIDYYRTLTEEKTHYHCDFKDHIKIDKEEWYQRIVNHQIKIIPIISNLGVIKSCYEEGKNLVYIYFYYELKEVDYVLWLLQK